MEHSGLRQHRKQSYRCVHAWSTFFRYVDNTIKNVLYRNDEKCRDCIITVERIRHNKSAYKFKGAFCVLYVSIIYNTLDRKRTGPLRLSGRFVLNSPSPPGISSVRACGVMTFYVVHMSISYAAISICAQTKLCSKKRAMTKEGVDLDMKLPSTL